MQQFQLAQNKKLLRIKCKEIRCAICSGDKIDRISSAICRKITELEAFKKAKSVMLFYPKYGEINLLPILNSKKNFYLPRCIGESMEICPYKMGDDLFENKYKILEPRTSPVKTLEMLDIVFVPALCADKKGYRLGWGMGYYDRFFREKNIKALKITVVPKELLFENIPKDALDVPCDIVVTQD
jgi:5-formyltetrahydrofolate cyclo-ligase